MTVAVDIVSLEDYDARRRQHLLLFGAQIPCPRCSGFNLYQSTSTVLRPVRTSAPATEGCIGTKVIDIEIALARCPDCKHRPRILPAILQPHKRTTTDVIEETVRLHAEEGESLRSVASRVEGATIAHTTIHAWTEGLGDYVAGRRAGEVADAAPAARVVAEAGRRYPEVREIPRHPVVLARLYRSEGRRIRLQGVLYFLRLAKKVSAASPLADLSAEFLTWTSTCHGLAFRTGRRCTHSEHPT